MNGEKARTSDLNALSEERYRTGLADSPHLARRVTPHAPRKAELIPYIPFDRSSATPFYAQIYNGYLAAIVSGRLRPGQRLPSTRALAVDLHISRIPVLNAFEQLLHEGYLDGRVGSGTYVRTPRPLQLVDRREHCQGKPELAEYAGEGEEVGPFSDGPAFDHFPSVIWGRLVRRYATHTHADLLAGADPAGYRPLRAAVAGYLRTARGIECSAGQVMIVSGSQMGLRLCAMTLVTPDSVVCMEEPGNPSARAALEIPGVQLAAAAVDEDGIEVDAVVRLGWRVKLTYVTPARQDPLGMVMSASRRRDLLTWAEQHDAWVVEGDFDSELVSSSQTYGALHELDTSGRVIYTGSFSRVLFPGIRTRLPGGARGVG